MDRLYSSDDPSAYLLLIGLLTLLVTGRLVPWWVYRQVVKERDDAYLRLARYEHIPALVDRLETMAERMERRELAAVRRRCSKRLPVRRRPVKRPPRPPPAGDNGSAPSSRQWG